MSTTVIRSLQCIGKRVFLLPVKSQDALLRFKIRVDEYVINRLLMFKQM